MPELEYFVVCESVSTDTETNRISLFNVIEDLTLSGSPNGVKGLAQRQGTPVNTFNAVSCWNRLDSDGEQDFEAKLRIHPTVGEPAKELTLSFKMQQRRQRLIMRVQGMPKMPPGDIQFELLLDSKHVAKHRVTVHELKEPIGLDTPLAPSAE